MIFLENTFPKGIHAPEQSEFFERQMNTQVYSSKKINWGDKISSATELNQKVLELITQASQRSQSQLVLRNPEFSLGTLAPMKIQRFLPFHGKSESDYIHLSIENHHECIIVCIKEGEC